MPLMRSLSLQNAAEGWTSRGGIRSITANIKRQILGLDEEHTIHNQIQEGKNRLVFSGLRDDRISGIQILLRVLSEPYVGRCSEYYLQG